MYLYIYIYMYIYINIGLTRRLRYRRYIYIKICTHARAHTHVLTYMCLTISLSLSLSLSIYIYYRVISASALNREQLIHQCETKMSLHMYLLSRRRGHLHARALQIRAALNTHMHTEQGSRPSHTDLGLGLG